MTAERNDCNGALEGSKVEFDDRNGALEVSKVEFDDCTGALEGSRSRSNVEFDGKSGLNSSGSGDLLDASGDSNHIASAKDVEIDRGPKDDAYSSYVLVDGGFGDPVDRDLSITDLKEDLEKKPAREENSAVESNAGSATDESKVAREELKEEKEESGKRCEEENGFNVDYSAECCEDTTVESRELEEEKKENEECCGENGQDVDKSGECCDSKLIEPVELKEEKEKSGECCGENGDDADESKECCDSKLFEPMELKEEKKENGECCGENGDDADESRECCDAKLIEPMELKEEKDENGECYGEHGDDADGSRQYCKEARIVESVEMEEEKEDDVGCGAEDGRDVNESGECCEAASIVESGEMEEDKEEDVGCGTEDGRDVNESGECCEEARIVESVEMEEDKETDVGCGAEDGRDVNESGECCESKVESGELKVETEKNGKCCEENGSDGNETAVLVDVLHSEPHKDETMASDDDEQTTAEVKENGGSEITATEVTASKFQQLDNQPEIESSHVVNEISVEGTDGELSRELDVNLESDTYSIDHVKVQIQESQIVVSEVDSKLHLLENGGEDTSNTVDAIPVAGPIADLEAEPEAKSEIDTRPADDDKLDVEVRDGSINSVSLEEEANDVSDESGELVVGDESATIEGRSRVEINVIDGSIESSGLETKGRSESPDCEEDNKPELDVDVTKGEVEIRNGSVQSIEVCPFDDQKSESGVSNGSPESSKNEPPPVDNETEPELEVGNGTGKNEVTYDHVEGDDLRPKTEDENVGKFPPCPVDEKPVTEVSKDLVESNADVLTKDDSAAIVSSDGSKVDAEVGKKLPCFMIRIPRYNDDKSNSEIDIAAREVDRRTQHRDSVRDAIKLKKDVCNEYRDNLESAKSEERAARDAVLAKRQELNSLQTMITRMKDATSIEEIEEQIHNMEHKIEHETVPLKEEKQLIREIKQLKKNRDELCAKTGAQSELQEAFDQRESVEKRFKLLKQELDSLRSEVSRIEGITKAAKQKFYDECKNLNELQAKFKDADVLRQEAYEHLLTLKKQFYEKTKYFRTYNEDKRTAWNYASTGNRYTLQCHCSNQVERIMELWNNNDEFRSDYVKNNMRSTLRRLNTLDGRSLGPDEKPPVVPDLVEERTGNATTLAVPMSGTAQEERGVPVVVAKASLNSAAELGPKNSLAKSKPSPKTSTAEIGLVKVPGRAETDEQEKERKRAKEEEEEMVRKADELARKERELARKEEELRKEEAAAILKEQRRLEEMAKAKEAEERKRRNAEKAQARAELRAQREAELKEKEREKKMRKKERKKAAAAAEGSSGSTDGETASVTDSSILEATREPEIKEKDTPASKRPAKSLPLAKQTKAKPLPLPLRNRNKRKMQPWMFVVVAAVLFLALFVAGNTTYFKLSVPSFSF